MVDPLLLILYVNDLPGVLKAQTHLFADSVKMVTHQPQNRTLHSSPYYRYPYNLVTLVILRRNWTYRSILLNASTPQFGAK